MIISRVTHVALGHHQWPTSNVPYGRLVKTCAALKWARGCAGLDVGISTIRHVVLLRPVEYLYTRRPSKNLLTVYRATLMGGEFIMTKERSLEPWSLMNFNTFCVAKNTMGMEHETRCSVVDFCCVLTTRSRYYYREYSAEDS